MKGLREYCGQLQNSHHRPSGNPSHGRQRPVTIIALSARGNEKLLTNVYIGWVPCTLGSCHSPKTSRHVTHRDNRSEGISVSWMANYVTVKVTSDWFEFSLLTVFRHYRVHFKTDRIQSTISDILSDRSRDEKIWSSGTHGNR
ncbi:hypothetical protein AVEN_18738-1 [Araneus ventricosus]|uniref:Uncharacterized protein n=1 Tax=Araneus ventricosus TaxID=182803 RepID=A0A4Y2GLC5_ARAVE|nr:hypothetical protein AVEN_18738-1 [Araneus ventricosus]